MAPTRMNPDGFRGDYFARTGDKHCDGCSLRYPPVDVLKIHQFLSVSCRPNENTKGHARTWTLATKSNIRHRAVWHEVEWYTCLLKWFLFFYGGPQKPVAPNIVKTEGVYKNKRAGAWAPPPRGAPPRGGAPGVRAPPWGSRGRFQGQDEQRNRPS